MEISQMSSEELALQFSEKTETQTPTITPEVIVPEEKAPGTMTELMEGMSSAEVAEKMTQQPPQFDEQGKPIEVAKPVEKEVKPGKVQLEEGFVNKLDDVFFKTDKLKPFLTEDGKQYVTPKTWEELSEVIEANLEDVRIQTKGIEKEALLKEVFQESSPAVQFILQNANSFRTPNDMLPLIQSVQQQDDFAALDATNPEHSEYIVENALALQGLDANAIAEEIDYLKESDKLQARAEKLKPILDNYSAQRTEQIIKEQEAKNQQDQKFWNNYYKKMNDDLLSSTDVDGMKIKAKDRQIIATALIPNQQTGGLPIYSIIDKLVGEGDIKLLSKAVLLLTDEKLYDSYYGSKKSDEISKGLQRQLRSSLKSSSEESQTTQQTLSTTKPQYGNFLGKSTTI